MSKWRSDLPEQVLREFREAAKYRGLPSHDAEHVDEGPDLWALYRRIVRDKGVRRIVGVR